MGSTAKVVGLFVGLNYMGTANRLSGCINDATDWAGRERAAPATTPGMACSEKRLLLEDEATKAGIVKAVEDCFRKLSAGDWFLWQFSGHGTYAADRNGDEPDGRDEALCPWDLNSKLLFDDEIYALLSRRPSGVRVLFVTDCCHSGTMSRNDATEGEPRFAPFASLGPGVRNLPRELERGTAPVEDVIHLSGCKDDEVSYDARFNGRASGAMTYFALAAYRSLPLGATFRQWFDAYSGLPRKNGYQQTPQITAEKSALDWVVPGRWADAAPPPVVGGAVFPPPPLTVEQNGWRGTVSDWKKI